MNRPGYFFFRHIFSAILLLGIPRMLVLPAIQVNALRIEQSLFTDPVCGSAIVIVVESTGMIAELSPL